VLRDVAASPAGGFQPSNKKGRDWICGWFGGCDYAQLRHGDLQEFFAWAWFDVFSYSKLDGAKRQEVDGMITKLESHLGRVAPGAASKVLKPQRQSMDPYWHNTTNHPLMFYAVFTLAVDVVAPWILVSKLGFVRRNAGRIKYYYHPGRRRSSTSGSSPIDRRPVLFWHGIGIGLAPYYWWLRNVLTLGRPVIVPEIPEAVCTLGSSAPLFRHLRSNRPVSVQETMEGFDEMLARVCEEEQGTEAEDGVLGTTAATSPENMRVSLIGHSFGTFVCSWLIEHRAARLAHVCLVDPVSVMLHHADVCDKFLYGKTSRLKEGTSTSKQVDELLRYFVRQEPGIVMTLMRNFWWYKNTTWLEDLVRLGPGCACVLLALNDEYCSINNIISGVEEMNRDVLEEAARASEKCEAKANGGDAAQAPTEMRHTVQLCQYPDTVHGQFLGHAEMQRQVLDTISA
jgi:pimeloyl-ACP methyl ester carboxylesterase